MNETALKTKIDAVLHPTSKRTPAEWRAEFETAQANLTAIKRAFTGLVFECREAAREYSKTLNAYTTAIRSQQPLNDVRLAYDEASQKHQRLQDRLGTLHVSLKVAEERRDVAARAITPKETLSGIEIHDALT